MSQHCEKKSTGAQIISNKIFQLIESEKTEQKSVTELRNISSEFASLGGIDDIVRIASSFFSTPVEDIPVENLSLDDKDKKMGKFKVSDLSDNPDIDVTKAFDLKEEDLEKLESVKFSISTPVIEVVKSLKFGLIETKIKFSITKKGFTFLPVLDQGVDSREKALETLKGVTVKLPLEISKVTLSEAKRIATETYPSSKKVLKAVKDSLTKEDFFQQINDLGIVLYSEVDVEETVRELLQLEDQSLLNLEDDCGYPSMVPAPFNPEELEKIEKDCCGDGEGSEKEFKEFQKEKEEKIKKLEKILEDPDLDSSISGEEADEALEDIDNFLNSLKSSNKIIQECSEERINALDNFYFFLEAKLLNEIALKYVEERAFMLDSLNGKMTSLISSRNQKIQDLSKLKEEENLLFVSSYNRLFLKPTTISIKRAFIGTSSTPPSSSGKTINGTFISNFQLSRIENDVNFKNAVKSIRKSIKNTENQISKLTSSIESQKKNFNLPSFNEAELQNIRSISLQSQNSVISQKTKFFRDFFSISKNPLSNQVGYDELGQNLKLLIHPFILNESKAIFSLNSPEVGEVSSYVQSLKARKEIYGKTLWNKFYSSSRIDQLFTYLEQGYTAPKPKFKEEIVLVKDDDGNVIDSITTQVGLEETKTTVKIPNPLGPDIEQEVSSEILNLDINTEIATDFWENLENKTYEKILSIIDTIKNSQEYISYIETITSAAHNEAKLSFAAGAVFQESSFNLRDFDASTNTFNFNYSVISNSLLINANTTKVTDSFKDIYTISHQSIKKFQEAIDDKLANLKFFIEEKKKCIAEQETKIEETSVDFLNASQKNFTGESLSSSEEKACDDLLGSDPYGLKPSTDCPGFTKNCYWKEYTKLMQTVSLMPIPDTQFLNRRLFRYYPVGLKIPVPVPPGVLPTLALGIPDPFISIPLPIIWKHIVSIYTPAGIFVVWVSLCGLVPGPYVLYIDEKNEPCFLVTPKGPISIPARSLGVTESEDKTLLEFLPIKDLFKVNLGVPPFDKLLGSSKIKLDEDAPETFIDSIQSRIKSAVDSLSEQDPEFRDLNGSPEEVKEKREKLERIKKAFDKFPPDIEAISSALESVEKVIDDSVDSMKISSVKFPKKPENLAVPPIGPAEFLDQVTKMVDSGVDSGELGLGVKILSLRKELRLLLDRKLSDKSVKESFSEINEEIQLVESDIENDLSDEEKILERVKVIKKGIKVPIEKVADEISPELLGFVSLVSVPLPLPVPCYDNNVSDPIPPYILATIGAIKQLPNLIDSISDEDLAAALSKFINLSAPLPRIEDIIFFAFNAFISFTPDLQFPDPKSLSSLKQVISSAAMNFFKLKIRPPKPGTVQVTITEDMIKSILKTAIKAVFAAVVKLIIDELLKAVNNKDVAMVLGVAAIIKGIFGTDLGNISGADIKSFLASSLETVDDQLENIKKFLVPLTKGGFKSIKEQLFPTIPPKINPEGPFLEVGTQEMLALVTPLLSTLSNFPIPYPLILLGCTTAPTRIVLTKIYPFAAKEPLPTWEKLSLKNIPFVIWLDQLVATAQRQGGLGSDYLAPYYLPDV